MGNSEIENWGNNNSNNIKIELNNKKTNKIKLIHLHVVDVDAWNLTMLEEKKIEHI